VEAPSNGSHNYNQPSPCRTTQTFSETSNDASLVDFVFEYLPGRTPNVESDRLAPTTGEDQPSPGLAPSVLSPGSASCSGTAIHDVQSTSLSSPNSDGSPPNPSPIQRGAQRQNSTRSASSASCPTHRSRGLSHPGGSPRDTGTPIARCWPLADENEVLLLRHFVVKLSLWVLNPPTLLAPSPEHNMTVCLGTMQN
jgi:hypothetical protein